jgi:hypothetical protein
MENTNPPMPPPPTGNQNPGYQQQPNPNFQQQQQGYQQNPYQNAPGGYQQQGWQGGMQQDLPGAGSVLTLGILGIVFSLGFLGLIFNIIALSKAGSLTREYNTYPGRYTASSFSKMKSGKVCAIIGLSITGLAVLIIAIGNA